MKAEVTRGQVSDYRGYDDVMDDQLPQSKVLFADKGYDSDAIREDVATRGGTAVIPARKARNTQGPVGGSINNLANLVERCINKLKNAQLVATRYDKTADSYLGCIKVVSARM